MFSWLKVIFKYLSQLINPRPKYVYFDDFSDCYAAYLIQELKKRTKV